MLKVLINERIKYLTLSKFIMQVVIIVVAALVFAIAAHQFGDSVQLVSGSFYLAFLKGGLNGIFLKPLIPILMITVTVSIIADDYTSGCMKFFLVSKMSRGKMFIGKILFLCMLTFILMLLTFLITALVGYLFFNDTDKIFTQTFFNILAVYTASAILIFPTILLTAFISLLSNSYQGALGMSLGAYLVTFMLDNFISKVRYISPTGGLSYCNTLFNDFNSGGIRFIIASLIYTAAFLIINIIIFKRKDMVL